MPNAVIESTVQQKAIFLDVLKAFYDLLIIFVDLIKWYQK